MRKKTEDSSKKRMKKRIAKKILIICMILIFIVISLYVFLTKNKTSDITYKENGNTDYNISISENEFFKDSILSANNQYISSIINKVNIKFKYNLSFSDTHLDSKYKYRIESTTKVIEKNTQNNLYTFDETLKEEEEEKVQNGKINIDDEMAIDYQKYDAMIKKLISTYELSNINCKTVVTLYVDLLDKNGNAMDTSKMSINIPLNVKTVNIETESSFSNTDEKLYEKGKTRKGIWLFLIIAVLLTYLEVEKIKNLVNYIKRNCPKEIIEKIKLKRILCEYKSYIQEIKEMFDMEGYTVLRMEKFDDMLRIREITGQPILMAENETKTKTYFTITTQNNMLYLYEINQGNVKEITE